MSTVMTCPSQSSNSTSITWTYLIGLPASTPPSAAATVESKRALKKQLVGRSPCDRIVVFDGNPRLAGTLAKVLVHDCTPTTLMGAIVTREMQHGDAGLLPILG